MVAGAVEDTEVEVIVLAMFMAVVAEEDVVEGPMFKTHMNLKAGMENLWQKILYSLKTNVESSPLNKIIIFNK